MFLPISNLDRVPVSNNGDSSSTQKTQNLLELPDTQVSSKRNRRKFSNSEKLRILKEAELCTKPGELGALLRREGIYSSTLSNFKQQQRENKLTNNDRDKISLDRKKQAAQKQEDARRMAQLEKENRQLKLLLDVQKKLSELLGISLIAE